MYKKVLSHKLLVGLFSDKTRDIWLMGFIVLMAKVITREFIPQLFKKTNRFHPFY
jgi:hypothetical protein